MYYLIDNKTGHKYKLSTWQLIGARAIPVISFIIYGLILVFIMDIFIAPSPDVMLIALALFYGLEVMLWITNKVSVGKIISALLLFVAWGSIFAQTIQHDLSNKDEMKHEINDISRLTKDIKDVANLCKPVDDKKMHCY
ncbi:hypothetical protein [uncultured Methanolobus sp.]|uniref:hypothetical protein n=1 Tax=uncultured Methanolobus sp. TaxID=218300 RepID=UPI002AAAF9BD|nr:hypothetical protein [uncultured Methanolobus sp.]